MNALAKYLESSGVSQMHLARKTGATPNTISRLVTGKTVPTLQLAINIDHVTKGAVSPYDWLDIKIP